MPETTTTRKRVLSGMRPTGKLHLGNYMGALKNWVGLQDKYECYFFIADLHALTTDYADPSGIKQNTLDVTLDFLAAGLDPEKSVIFVQSHVPQHAELFALFSMFTPLGWLERVPTYKDQQEQLKEKDLNTYGFLGYPLLMSADILLYQPKFVPVGLDQTAHVEVTREIARRFNGIYRHVQQVDWRSLTDAQKESLRKEGREIVPNATYAFYPADVLPEPDVLLTPSPKLPGIDGRKMSKSYGNTILLSEQEADIRAKLKTMVTDPARVRRTDAGNPEVCPVGDLHKVFSSDETRLKVWEGCTTAGIGCIECKSWVADGVIAELRPIQERRKKYESSPGLVTEILAAGKEKAAARAEQTMTEVRAAMGLS
jgi:tryptophanyl-tRNA synthetase